MNYGFGTCISHVKRNLIQETFGNDTHQYYQNVTTVLECIKVPTGVTTNTIGKS